MFTSGELEAIPEELTKLFKNMESDILEDIVRRIRINSEITRSAEQQIDRLNQIGAFKKDIKKYIQETLRLSDQQISKLYEDVISSGYARDKSLYEATGKEFIPFEENESLQQVISAVSEQTKEEFKNITGTMGFITDNGSTQLVNDYFTKTLDKTSMEIASGAFDYQSSIKKTVNEMANSGIRYVNYVSESGKPTHNRIDVAVRRAVMTGLNQVTGKISDDNMEKLATEYCEVSYHSTARPTHQVWQGRVYTKDQLVSVCGLGSVTGLLGANCYHHYDAFVPGISTRNYTDEQLDQMNAEANRKQSYNGKEYTKYEATQRQRQLETQMRAQRQKINLLKQAEGKEEDIIAQRGKYRSTMAEYKDFSKQMNLPVQTERIYVDGLKGIGKGKYKN